MNSVPAAVKGNGAAGGTISDELTKAAANSAEPPKEAKPEKAKAKKKAKATKKAKVKKPVNKAAKKSATTKKAEKKAGEKKPKGQGIGAFCEGLLKLKKSTEDILKAVQAKFPGAKTSPASIAWYRNKMREEGTLPKS